MPIEEEVGKKSRRSKESKTRRLMREVTPADWGSVQPELIAGVVVAVATSGGAVRFGYTSDGGAYAIGLYGDGDPYTEYVRPAEDIEVVLKGLIEIWT